MICIKADVPEELCDIDDELKAIYHSRDTVCIWVFKTREDRNRFMDETAGMLKDARERHYEKFYLRDCRWAPAVLMALKNLPGSGFGPVKSSTTSGGPRPELKLSR
jgi:hypothetical protein